jgi:hypothetical protein
VTRGLGTLLALWLLPHAAIAQDGALGALQRNVELPAHRGLMAVVADPETTLAPFVTDGCSGGLSATWEVVADLFPDFEGAHSREPPWEACCIAHDLLYHDASGSTSPAASFDARLAADEALRVCVVTNSQERIPDLADLYDVTAEQVRLAYGAIGDATFNAVRFGGAPCSGLPWRWGYGYPGCLPSLN